MARIVIYLHRNGSIHDPCGYFLREIAAVWQFQGHQLFAQHGPGEHINADIVINHVDLTVVPADHVPYMANYPTAMNREVLDISKRAISRDSLDATSLWEGPVIAKTNLNCGGWKEAELGIVRDVPAEHYAVFPHMSAVPEAAWSDSRLVVEKFQPETRDGLYCLRTWMFLGDQETNSLSYSKDPIIKQRSVLRRVPVPHVPDDLRAMREELRFDFGKFDYAIVDGKSVLYDANRTPSLGNFNRSEFMPRIKTLASGLAAFL